MREKYLMVQTLPRREMGPAPVRSGDKTGDWCCRTILDPRRVSVEMIQCVGYLLSVASSDQIISAVSPLSPLTSHLLSGQRVRSRSRSPSSVPSLRVNTNIFLPKLNNERERRSPQSRETLSHPRTSG